MLLRHDIPLTAVRSFSAEQQSAAPLALPQQDARPELSHYRAWPMSAFPSKPDYVRTLADVSKVHKTEIKTSVAVALVQCLCNLFHQFAFGIGLLKYSRFAEIL